MEGLAAQFKLFTLQEVASILRVNRSSVSRLIKGGGLAYIQVGGRKLICESDLALFIDKHKARRNDDCECRSGG